MEHGYIEDRLTNSEISPFLGKKTQYNPIALLVESIGNHKIILLQYEYSPLKVNKKAIQADSFRKAS